MDKKRVQKLIMESKKLNYKKWILLLLFSGGCFYVASYLALFIIDMYLEGDLRRGDLRQLETFAYMAISGGIVGSLCSILVFISKSPNMINALYLTLFVPAVTIILHPFIVYVYGAIMYFMDGKHFESIGLLFIGSFYSLLLGGTIIIALSWIIFPCSLLASLIIIYIIPRMPFLKHV